MEKKMDLRTEFASNNRVGSGAIIMGKRKVVLIKTERYWKGV